MSKKPLRELVAIRLQYVLDMKKVKPSDIPRLTSLTQEQVDAYLSGKSDIPLAVLDEFEHLFHMPIVEVANRQGDFGRDIMGNAISKLK